MAPTPVLDQIVDPNRHTGLAPHHLRASRALAETGTGIVFLVTPHGSPFEGHCPGFLVPSLQGGFQPVRLGS